MLYPLTFIPRFKERVWGGRKLQHLYKKELPPSVPIGESWELTDREGDVSVIANGPLAGKNLQWLLQHHSKDLLGNCPSANGRFPWLIKILDAQEKLSLQVHPPAEKATVLQGEPKTEMWYVADAIPGAELYVGLKNGVTRKEFEEKVAAQTVEECFHRLSVRRGDTMFLPSGRVHALGAGLVIFEIQQNSDTTYRVFDWNRLGLDGKSRALHIAESLASIDFEDFEPKLVSTQRSENGLRSLVRDPLFNVALATASHGKSIPLQSGTLSVLGVVQGHATIGGGASAVMLESGQFCLIPAACSDIKATLSNHSEALLVTPGTK